MSFRMSMHRALCISGLLLSAASLSACGSPPMNTDPPVCSNGTKDSTESDVDCGGSSTCSRCGEGKACTVNSDCQEGQCMSGVCSACPLLDKQLIVNPDAEAGPAAPDQGTLLTIPGWTSTTQFTVIAYGSPGGFPSTTDPGPDQRGKNFFTGGNVTPSKASQTLDLSACSALIDAGSLKFNFSGYVGGLTNQGDSATVDAYFFDDMNTFQGAGLASVSAADRNNMTKLLRQEVTLDTVRKGSRKLVFEIISIRKDGTGNDGYVDNLSAVLSRK